MILEWTLGIFSLLTLCAFLLEKKGQRAASQALLWITVGLSIAYAGASWRGSEDRKLKDPPSHEEDKAALERGAP